MEQQNIAIVITALISGAFTYLAAKSQNKVTLEAENVKNATSLYEEYKELNQQLKDKVDKLEKKIEELESKYASEIEFYKGQIVKLETKN
ncbi:MAG: hypothetical protein LKF42_09220, partial [Streptococcaceae bacterium]|nr:hypothetical protein [Streptococcaceae bacterium]